MQGDLPYICLVFFCRCRVVVLHSFITCLVSVLSSGPFLLEINFYRSIVSLVNSYRVFVKSIAVV